MHVLKRQGDNIGALALVMIDNPMCPGTGHRICNDCMKGCIYQKTEPVNIPQIETNVLTDVLFMPFGFEVYSLLTRWNPLNVKRPHMLPYNGKNVLVVGMGPAGYTLAHYLLNEGFGVVGIDGLKSPASARELYAAALDMAEWGEREGCVQIVVSEHHGIEDGYLPSPLAFAGALAGRTRKIGIQIGALVVPLHDPIRLAEDMAVLDLISGGRISFVTAVGYRPEEYEMLGRDFKQRGQRMEECLTVIQKAFRGEPFEYQGRTIHITPKPFSPAGPTLLMGGNTGIAARRAARFDMGMLTQGLNPNIESIYTQECVRLGKEPKAVINPPDKMVMSAYVAEDPDRAWAEVGPYMLHDAKSYAKWLGKSSAVTKSTAQTLEDLRHPDSSYRIFTPDEAVEYIRTHYLLLLQPLVGGLPPDLAWQSLELIKAKVLPRTSQ